MKSRITIEVDFENRNQPYILIQKDNSDDVRDKLLSHFTQQFGGSSWCQIRWQEPISANGANLIRITPIPPNKLKEQSEIMLEQHNINEMWLANHIDKLPKETTTV